MKHIFTAIAAICLITSGLIAQNGQYDVAATLAGVDCAASVVFIDVKIKATDANSTFRIAEQNYRFSYSGQGLAPSSIFIEEEGELSGIVSSSGGLSVYDTHTLSGSTDTIISYNIELGGGDGYLITADDWVYVGRLGLQIADETGCFDFQFHDQNAFPGTFVSEKFNGSLVSVAEGNYQNLSVCLSDFCAIYPGDTNLNGKVEASDILYWGAAYDNTGPIRPNADTTWTAQICEDWTTEVSGVNNKYQDTNGDGIINDADLNAMIANFDSITPAYVNAATVSDADYTLDIIPTSDVVVQGGTTRQRKYDLLIEHINSIPVAASGLAFIFEYENLQSGSSVTVNLNNSALGNTNDLGLIQHFNPDNGRLHVGISRKPANNIPINGAVVELIVEDPIKGPPPGSSTTASIFNTMVSTVLDTIKPVNGPTIYVPDETVSQFVPQPVVRPYITVTPPTCSYLGQADIRMLELGEYTYEWSNGANTAELQDLAPGIYSVTISEPSKLPAIVDIEVHAPAGCPDEVLISTKVFLQGAYNETTGLMNDKLRTKGLIPLRNPYMSLDTLSPTVLDINGEQAIVDWLELELRSIDNPALVVNRCAALLRRNGELVATDGFSPVKMTPIQADSVYLVIKHRNHLPIMSPPVANTDIIDYNFTTNDAYTLIPGTGQTELDNGVWAMIAGETIKDNTINGDDKTLWDLLNGTFSVYHETDINLDGDVNSIDKIFWRGNNGLSAGIP